jgi:hypothetical protein
MPPPAARTAMRSPTNAPKSPRRPRGSATRCSSQRCPQSLQARYRWSPRRSAITAADPHLGQPVPPVEGRGGNPRLVLIAGPGPYRTRWPSSATPHLAWAATRPRLAPRAARMARRVESRLVAPAQEYVNRDKMRVLRPSIRIISGNWCIATLPRPSGREGAGPVRVARRHAVALQRESGDLAQSG